MGHSGDFNPPPTGPTHSNQKVFISRLLNSVFYSIGTLCFASIMGTQVFPLEVEFLDKLPYWNVELEADFKEQLVEKFNIDIDLSEV